jgi:DUF1009 family protein
MKIALISCNGQLPVIVQKQLQNQGHDVKIICFHEVKSLLPADYTVSLGQMGKILDYLKKHNIDNIMFAGGLNRPILWRLRFDYRGIKFALRLIRFLKKGDDALLRFVCDYLAHQGLKLQSIADLCPKLLMPLGDITRYKANQDIMDSVAFGQKILNSLSPFDIGQSIAIAGQVVIAIEAIDGTDAMINHVGQIDKNRLNGLPKPIFIKMRKKNQSNLIDLPTIGVETIDNLYKAGLKAAAIEAGGCLVLDIEAVIKRAEILELCIVGFSND